jgi:hypothetical protein
MALFNLFDMALCIQVFKGSEDLTKQSVQEPKDKERMKKRNPSHGSCTQESTRNPKSNNLCSLQEIMVNNP